MNRNELAQAMMTGVDSIDEEHRTIFELWDDFIDPYTIKAGGTIFQDALVCLADYIAYHFASEEFTMREVDYPNYESHRLRHDFFTEQMSDYVKGMQRRENSTVLTWGVSFILTRWIREHVSTADQELAKFLFKREEVIYLHSPLVAALKTSDHNLNVAINS